MSDSTKRILANSLKQLLSKKTLNKITVIDIVKESYVNRQTFYYHFHDIYELVEWTYLNETTEALNGNSTYDTWQKGFLNIFQYVLNNKDFVKNTYRSINRSSLEQYLYREVYNLLIKVVEEEANGMNVQNDLKIFISNFYKYAFVGLMLDWIGKDMKESPESLVKKVSSIVDGDIIKVLKKFKS